MSEEKSVVVTPTVWSLARELASQGYLLRNLEVAQAAYQELFNKCLEQDLDLTLVLGMIYSIDSELVKEDQGVQEKGVPSEAKNK